MRRDGEKCNACRLNDTWIDGHCVNPLCAGEITLRGVSKPKMVMRSLRVPEKLWEAAKAKADQREENISDVIREALERYVKRK